MRNSLLTVALLLTSNMSYAYENAPFEGWYAGANVGWAEGTTQDNYNPSSDERDLEGNIGGLQVGYNWQLVNNIVLGIEGGLSLSNIEDENGGNLEGNNEWYGNSEIKNTANLNLKIGYAFYNWLPYVTTGLTVASMDYMSGCQSNGQSMGSDCETPFESSADDFRVGYNVGAGVQYKFMDSFSAAIEYSYTDLGKSTANLYDPNFPKYSRVDYETKFQTMTLRINYHF